MEFRIHVFTGKGNNQCEYVMAWRKCSDYTLVEIIEEFGNFDFEIEYRTEGAESNGSKQR